MRVRHLWCHRPPISTGRRIWSVCNTSLFVVTQVSVFSTIMYILFCIDLKIFVGTPFCITVDFDSLTDESVTVRFRDSMQQSRIKIADLYPFLSEEIDGF